MTHSRRHVAKHAHRTTDEPIEPIGAGGRSSAHADESDISAYLDFARPPRPHDFAGPPETDDTAQLYPGPAPASAPFADAPTELLFAPDPAPAQWRDEPDPAPAQWRDEPDPAPAQWRDEPAHPAFAVERDAELSSAGPSIRPFPAYEPFVDDLAYSREREERGTSPAFASNGFEDTIVFPSAGAERLVRSHRRDEPGRRVAFRVVIASAISGSGLAIMLAALGGGAPAAPDVPAALPRVAASAGGAPTTTAAPPTPPTPSPEPTTSVATAPTSAGQPAAQVRNAPRAPQTVGTQPGNDATTTPAPAPAPTTPPPTTEPTTPPSTGTPTTPPTVEPTTEPTSPPSTGTPTSTPTTSTTTVESTDSP